MRLNVEPLEDRLTPAGFFLTGVGGVTAPAEPNVRTYDASTVAGGSSTFLTPPGDIGAFPGFTGAVRVANGDVNGDGIDDIIAAQGAGRTSGSQVRIFDGYSSLFLGTAVELASFFAFSNEAGASQTPGFAGGVFVAAADFNGDGFDELVVSAGAGARGHIKVFNFHDGAGGFLASTPELRSSFYSYTDFAGEIRITTLRAGATTYLVTGSGAGVSQSDVRLYANAFTLGQIPDLTFVAPAAQVFPYAGYKGGVSVAGGDTDGDGQDELFVSKNSGTSLVSVFDLNNLTAPKLQFEAFGGFNGEVRLGAADVDGDGKVEVLTSTGDSPGAGGAHIKVWQIGAGATELRSFFAYPGYSRGRFPQHQRLRLEAGLRHRGRRGRDRQLPELHGLQPDRRSAHPRRCDPAAEDDRGRAEHHLADGRFELRLGGEIGIAQRNAARAVLGGEHRRGRLPNRAGRQRRDRHFEQHTRRGQVDGHLPHRGRRPAPRRVRVVPGRRDVAVVDPRPRGERYLRTHRLGLEVHVLRWRTARQIATSSDY